MMAVILAGGKGTRLKPFTMTIPKPLLPLGDVPILEVVIRQLVSSGVERIVVTLGHMAHLFAGSIGDGARFGVRIEYCMEEDPLGTAGSLLLVRDPEEVMIVMNGDILTTLSYTDLLAFHKSKGAVATISAHRRVAAIDYGVLETTDEGRLVRYVEKPSMPYRVSMGINVVSRESIDLIPRGVKFDMPQLMQAISDQGQLVQCFESDCYWQDIGRFDDYQQASADFAADPCRFLGAYRTS